WVEKQLVALGSIPGITFRNASDETGALAVQGPRVAEFIDSCFPGSSTAGTSVPKASALQKNQIAQFAFEGLAIWVSRTGYTGEDGFEVLTPAEIIVSVWNKVQKAGQPYGLKPAGLGARDTLRTEVCYPLYGHELDEINTPIEAGLGLFVSLDKGDFIGRGRLVMQKEKGVRKKLVAFRMTDKSAPPRPQYTIWSTGEKSSQIGEVVSGTQSP